MSKLEITPVTTKSQMRAFITLPWRLYKNDPNWVPPLKRDFTKLMDTNRHPFWHFSQRELYLAWRNGRPVGRVAAIIDGNYNKHNNEKVGAFGFFECENDPEAAAGLFEVAEKWVKERDMKWFRGPLNPSINHEIGMLIDGFGSPPTLGFTHNPEYYPALVEGSGFGKDKDVLAYWFDRGNSMPDWFKNVGKKLYDKGEFTIRMGDVKNLEAEVLLVNDIYNECWADNWGAVPMTNEEIIDVAHDMKPFLDPDLLFFICHEGEPIGVCLSLPDVNRLLMKLNGWLNPLVLFRHLVIKPYIVGLRGYILGIKSKYRLLGAPLVGFYHLMMVLDRKKQYEYVELGWQLEDNTAINSLIEDLGGKVSRRFRVYGKTV